MCAVRAQSRCLLAPVVFGARSNSLKKGQITSWYTPNKFCPLWPPFFFPSPFGSPRALPTFRPGSQSGIPPGVKEPPKKGYPGFWRNSLKSQQMWPNPPFVSLQPETNNPKWGGFMPPPEILPGPPQAQPGTPSPKSPNPF